MLGLENVIGAKELAIRIEWISMDSLRRPLKWCRWGGDKQIDWTVSKLDSTQLTGMNRMSDADNNALSLAVSAELMKSKNVFI